MTNNVYKMTKNCVKCQTSFEITEDDLAFYDKVSPIIAGKKYLIPPPTLCPDCRKQRRTSWRNERCFYGRKCDLCQKDVISLYSPDKKYKVYCKDCWWSDAYNPVEYGRDFDFSKSFTEQFRALQLEVPRLTLFNTASENSDYSNHASRNKNCYLISASFDCENVYHSWHCLGSKDSMDCNTCVKGSQLCYECSQCENCYNLHFSQYCKGCQDSFFLYDCNGCSYCYRCSGLRNKQYCFENKQYTKEEWQKLVPDLSSYQTLAAERKKYLDFIQLFPRQNSHLINCTDSSGDDLRNCNQCKNCYEIQDAEHCKNMELGEEIRDCYDCFGAGPAELLYEIHGMASGYGCAFSHASYTNTSIYYCDNCQNSQNLFGCVGMKKNSYCIFNKQYSKEEYEQLVPRIIEGMLQRGEYGEFFPSSLSPFGYNETVVQDYFPLTRDQVMETQKSPLPPLIRGAKGGFNWSDYVSPKPEVKKIIPASKLPDSIKDIPDDILNWAIECEVTKKPYRIIKQELKFYRDHNLPIPRRHPDQRHKDRMALRNPRKLWDRVCMQCNKPIQTTYSPDRPEVVYCEACYLREVY